MRVRKLNAFERGVALVDIKVWMYLSYLLISVGLTVWVATVLSRNGLVFLEEVFAETRLARAVNQLLVVGFYLLNLGFVTVAMRSDASVADTAEAMERLSLKIGLVLLVLGALHFFNVFALGRYRRNRLRQQLAYPPVAPAGRLPMPPAPPVPVPVPIPVPPVPQVRPTPPVPPRGPAAPTLP